VPHHSNGCPVSIARPSLVTLTVRVWARRSQLDDRARQIGGRNQSNDQDHGQTPTARAATGVAPAG
jgi:hypothetical protein